MFPEIPNYTIVREIGAGGMAVVYEAVDVRLQRTVAIKVLHPHRCREEAATDRFMREARAAAKIDHPNVVRIFEYAAIGDLHYIVMEFVPGTTAERVLKERGNIPVDTVIAIMSQIAEALSQAHALGIIHRDVKPANILLHSQGRAMLSDFGLAHHLPDARLTTENAVAGTPMYMSPEQISGRALGPATDIYSWAICFCVMVAGKLPYRSEEYPDVIADIRKGAVRFDDALAGALPGRYLDLLHRCLAADPGERIGDALELCGRLVLPGMQAPGKIDLSQVTAIGTSVPRDGLDPTATAVIPKKRLRAARRTVAGVTFAVAMLLMGLFIASQRVGGSRAGRGDASHFVAGAGHDDTVTLLGNKAITAAPKVAATIHNARGTTEASLRTGRPEAAGERRNSREPPLSSSPEIDRSLSAAASSTGAAGLPVALPHDSGGLFIHCTPWAIVSVNGREIGTTPFEKPVPLPAGVYSLTLTNGFCNPLTDSVTIGAGTIERRKYVLEATSR